jgi:hypothetical protein
MKALDLPQNEIRPGLTGQQTTQILHVSGMQHPGHSAVAQTCAATAAVSHAHGWLKAQKAHKHLKQLQEPSLPDLLPLVKHLHANIDQTDLTHIPVEKLSNMKQQHQAARQGVALLASACRLHPARD